MSKRSSGKSAKAKQLQQQRMLIVIGGAVAAVVVIGAIVLFSLPAGAELPDGIEDKYAGIEQSVSAEGYPMLGDPDAPVLVQEFSSYTCPHCKDLHEDVMSDELLPFIRDGQVRLISVPFDRRGQDETDMVRAAFCAMEQGMFFEMNSVLYHWRGSVSFSKDRVESAASELGMDEGELLDCMNSNVTNRLIEQARTDFTDRGLTGTPTVFVNRRQTNTALIINAVEDALLTASGS